MTTEADHAAALDGLAGVAARAPARAAGRPGRRGDAHGADPRARRPRGGGARRGRARRAGRPDRRARVRARAARAAAAPTRRSTRSWSCGTAPVWVERARPARAHRRRASRARPSCAHAIERILAPLGRRVDEAEPLCDARLPDGSRVNVVIPPLALDGPVLTIRRFRRRGFTPEELVANGTLTAPAARASSPARCGRRCNVLVCGGTGSGKTTHAQRAVRASSTPASAWSRSRTPPSCGCASRTCVRLEARPPNLEGRGEVTIRRLVKQRAADAARPDRRRRGPRRRRRSTC